MTSRTVRETNQEPFAARAEQRVTEAEAREPPRAPDQVVELLHELRVHQVELDMQNEELRRAQGALDAVRAQYFARFELAPVGYVTLGASGSIRDINLRGSMMLGLERSKLTGQPLSRFIVAEDQDAYYLHGKRLVERG